jgi:uncharacterized membrane protein
MGLDMLAVTAAQVVVAVAAILLEWAQLLDVAVPDIIIQALHNKVIQVDQEQVQLAVIVKVVVVVVVLGAPVELRTGMAAQHVLHQAVQEVMG